MKAGLENVTKSTRCRILKSIGTVKSPRKKPVLTAVHKQKRLSWAWQYMKTDFQQVVWTDESCVTLNGPNRWARGWMLKGCELWTRVKRQNNGGGLMIWAGIVGSTLIGPFRIPQGVKINRLVYCQLLEDKFLPWLDSVPSSEKEKLIFMQDKAPSHAAKFTTEWLGNSGFKSGENLMIWPPNSPDLNPIEHFWAIIKLKVYADNQQIKDLETMWKAIQRAAASTLPGEISALTKSVDRRLVAVLEANGGHTKKY